jgi:heat-inducible transcriptional repressor
MQRDHVDLTNREREVLQYIIQNFIVTANPIASKTLIAKHNLNVSSATIRNDMNSLELKGYLDHPHTSSGRVPTELGYRFYVNSLMQVSRLTNEEQKVLDEFSETLVSDFDDAVQSAARLLARLSNLLAVTITPKLADGIFRRMELIELSSTRILIVLTIDSGFMRTLTIEAQTNIQRENLEKVARVLNERLSGLRLNKISNKIGEMLADYEKEDDTGLIRIFIDRADSIFEDRQVRKFHFGGVEYIALQPEFSDLSNYRGIIELLEKEDLIVHLLEENMDESRDAVRVRIGTENRLQQIEQCSVVSANYNIGSIRGTIGLVGPTRMDYARMVALVDQLADRFNRVKFDT